MNEINRRHLIGGFASAALAGATTFAVAKNNNLKLLLNTSYSGPVAFFLLAQDKDYYRKEGLKVQFSPGGGAAAIVPRVRHGDFDAGYGDITALIERIARGPKDKGPVAVYTTFNAVPFTIAVAADGPIKTPKDLEGRIVSGHGSDAALITFDMFAKATGIDASKVQVKRSGGGMGQQVVDVLNGKNAHGVFGFVQTIIATTASYGVKPNDIRFLEYADYIPDMYGNTLFVTRETYENRTDEIEGLIRATNRGLRDTVANTEEAMDALGNRVGNSRRAINETRLVGTLRTEMAHPEGAKIGIGEMDDSRLERLIRLIVETKNLPRTPSVREVFDRSFLPPLKERVRSLGK